MGDFKRHKKVRFGGRAKNHLRALPSHDANIGPVHAPILAPSHLLFRRFWIGLLALIVISVVALGVFVGMGYLKPVLQRAANDALISALPNEYRVELGKTDVSVSVDQGIGIGYSDLKLFSQESGEMLASVGGVNFGITLKSVLSGKSEFSSIFVKKVNLVIKGSETKGLPTLQLAKAHDSFEKMFENIQTNLSPALNQSDGLRLQVDHVNFTLPENGYSKTLDIRNLQFKAHGGTGDFNASLDVGGKVVPVNGTLKIPLGAQGTDAESSLALSMSAIPMPWRRLQTIVSNDPIDLQDGKRFEPLLADVSIDFVDRHMKNDDVAAIKITPIDMSFKLGVDDFVPVTGFFDLNMNFQTAVLRFNPTSWKIGRSSFDLNGGVRDRTFENEKMAEDNAFEFELLANRGTAAPADSPEEPLRFAARAQGTGFLNSQNIEFTRLDVDSDNGSAMGEGVISLLGAFQTAIFDVRVDDMSIAGVKQFWPAPVARGARRWVLENLAGGRVITGQFDIAEPLRRRIEGTDKEFTGDTNVKLDVENVRFNVVGDIPPVNEAKGSVTYAEGVTQVSLKEGVLYLPSGKAANARDGVLTIPKSDEKTGLIRAELDLGVSGQAKAIGELITLNPISAQQYYAFKPADLAGTVNGRVKVDFLLNGENGPDPDWDVDFEVTNAGSATKIEGRALDSLDGRIKVDPRRADFDLKGNIDGLPSDIAMVIPFGNSGVKAKRDIRMLLDTANREKLAPGLDTILTGRTPVKVAGSGNVLNINADLTAAKLQLPWIGWAKGSGIKASAGFNLIQNGGATSLSDFKLTGGTFGASGKIDVDEAGLKRARFGFAQLTSADNVALDIQRNGNGFSVNISGKSFDARAIMRHARAQTRSSKSSDTDVPVDVTGTIGRVIGFHGEHLNNVKLRMRVRGGTVTLLTMTGSTKSGFPVTLNLDGAGSGRSISLEALGAGEFLRFADLYTNVRGGKLNLSLNGSGPQSLSGRGTLQDFRVFNEPKLAQLVSSKSGKSRSLEEAVNKQIDTREVKFEVARSDLTFKPGQLNISKAIARGPLAGFSIQGLVFDANNQTRLTGTFLPAYGLNRLFAEIPILGALLGNGRDRGLIGVTFKLDGSYDNPRVTVNPLSVIAPGIFRSIFEFR